MADLSNAPSLCNAFGDTAFDYTFTDKELQDVLGYMERQQSVPCAQLDPLPFLSSPNPTALQFQPRADFVAVKQEPFDMMDLGGLTLGGGLGGMVPTSQPTAQSAPLPNTSGPSGSSSSSGVAAAPVAHISSMPELATPMSPAQPAPLLQQPAALPPQAPRVQQAPVAARQAPAVHPRKDVKPHVSHSTVEKQRRDRINSLIDELRELVPPSRHDGCGSGAGHHHHGGGGGGSGGGAHHDPHDVKRPKHVVLSDTIAMVKELQERLHESESRMARLREHEEHCPFHDYETHQAVLRQHHQNGAGDRENSSGSSGHCAHPELPHAPEGLHTSEQPSVEVEEGEDGCLYVKVSCRDRHGLLADIVRVLKSLPLEIVTAAITTTRDCGVYDVFQVAAEEGAVLMPAAEVAACVRGVLMEHHTGDKRRRDS